MPSWGTNYRFTGTLRPCQQSPTRVIPQSIARPDYATHINGVSNSEQVSA